MDGLTNYVGWVTAIEGWVTGVIPAGLLLSGYWRPEHNQQIGIALGIFAVVVFTVLWPVTRPPGQATRTARRAGGTTAAGAH
jgi:hypothetical protein